MCAGGKFFGRCRHLLAGSRHLANQIAQIGTHGVKGIGQHTDFIIGFHRQIVHGKIPIRHLRCMRFQQLYRLNNAAGKAPADTDRKEQSDNNEHAEHHLQMGKRGKHKGTGHRNPHNPTC